MKVTTGKVVGGNVVVDGGASLTEGASVTVLEHENDETFEATSEEEIALLRGVADADRSDFVSAEQVLEDLRTRVR